MAAELEQALEEVRMRNSEADERQLEIEDAMRRAMEAEREASKEKGRLQARMAQVGTAGRGTAPLVEGVRLKDATG